jgi:hypothetical protein
VTKNSLIIVGCSLVLCGCASASAATTGTSGAASSTTSSQSSSSTQGSSAGASQGQLVGVARLYGGPMNSDGKMGLNGDPGSDIHVKVSHAGRVVATMVTGNDGRFAFHLEPGRYVVSGCASFTVVVRAGATAAHDLTCPVP